MPAARARPLATHALALALGGAIAWGLFGGTTRDDAAELPPDLDGPPAREPSGPDPRVLAALERIEERLAALERGRPSAAAPAPAADESRTALPPAAQPTDELLAELTRLRAALEQSLEQHRRLIEAGSLASRVRSARDAMTHKPVADWTELDALTDLYRLDEARARRETMLMTYEEVVTRFGSPTETWSNDDGAHWVYQDAVDPVSGEANREVYLRFQDGHVTVLGVKTE